MEILSDEEEEEEEEVVVGVSEERYRPQSLDKMIALVALLVEKSRGENNHLQLMHKDYNAIIGGKVSWRFQGSCKVEYCDQTYCCISNYDMLVS